MSAAATLAVHHPHVTAVHAVLLLHPATVKLIRTVLAAVAGRKPKVSVVTPTWRRARLLLNRCIPSVQAQTYRGEIEHIIVSDGPDPALDHIPGVHQLAEHRLCVNRGVWARLAGTELATGEIFAYLDDDNAWRPRHLEVLVDAITASGVSFAYSQALCQSDTGLRWVIGCNRPVFAQIDTSLIVHNAGLLETATWEPSGRPADWHLVDRWLAAGATWAHVPEITLDYYARRAAATVT